MMLDGIIFTCSGGVDLARAAMEAYEIGRGFGIPVSVIHNDRMYKVELTYTQTHVTKFTEAKESNEY